MSGFYKKAVVWLGLDEQYPDGATTGEFDDEGHDTQGHDTQGHDVSSTERRRRTGVASEMDSSHIDAGDDPLAPAPLDPERESTSTVRAVPLDKSRSANTQSSGTVRAVPLAVTAEPETIVPSSYNNAQDVADIYKRLRPVVLDLTNAERDLARRLIDFSAGLCYGLGGQMEKLDRDRYLLTPEGIELTAADRRALES